MAHESQNSGDSGLCANNCGFYGNPATNNFCSKCYKDHLMKQPTKEVVVVERIEKKMAEEEEEEEPVVVVVEEVGGSSKSKNVEIRANRCSLCKKRVGLTGFKCRCEQTFCSLHRYSDKHDCGFDYKGTAQDAIARANPVIKADKIEKI